MGSYTFRWEHPADEVYVTGTFDNWGKTIKLDKSGAIHEKTVPLKPDEKVLYKFVADGNWNHDHTAKNETDHEGNINNVLYPEDIRKSPSSTSPSSFNTAAAAISSVAPGASTTKMAGRQPMEASRDLPGAFPETPAGEFPPKMPSASDEQTFSANPLPATSGTSNPVSLFPGEKVPAPESLHGNTLTSNVKLDKESYENPDTIGEQSFSAMPLPATGGIGNPVSLQPGEKVPEPQSLTGHTLTSNVKLDKDSYEHSDSGAPILPAPLSPTSEKEAFGEKSIFGTGLGPQTSNMIPESSMGMGKDTPAAMENVGPMTSGSAMGGTTNALAGAQPIEPRGVATMESASEPPAMVAESQEKAHVDPEATANPEAVQEKDQVEQELLSKVSAAPATTSSSMFGSSEKGVMGAAAGGLATAGGLAAAGAAYVHEHGKKAAEQVQQQAPSSTIGSSSSSGLPQSRELEQGTSSPTTAPGVVAESQQQAGVAPEASTNPEAVQEKGQVEDELLTKVPEAPATASNGMFGSSEKGVMGMAAGGVAAATGAAAAGAAYLSQAKDKAVQQAPESLGGMAGARDENVKPILGGSTAAPAVVSESQQEAGAPAEASANPEAVQEKDQLENELLAKVPKAPATASNGVFGSSEKGVLAGGVAAATGPAAAGAAYLGQGKDKENVVPMISPLSGGSTTAAPPVITESQQEAGVPAEASANPAAVQEKDQVENELLTKVPEAPAASSNEMFGKSEGGVFGSSSGNGVMGMAAGGVAAAGATAAGAAYLANDKLKASTGRDAVGALPASVQDSIASMNNKGASTIPFATSTSRQGISALPSYDATIPQQTHLGQGIEVPAEREVASSVPEEVLHSQKEAGVGAEAAAIPEAVQEKSAVESELLSKVQEHNESGEPAPTIGGAALTSTAPGTSTLPTATTTTFAAPQLGNPVAGVGALSMDDSSAVPVNTLAKETTAVPIGTASSSGLNAPASEPALPSTQESSRLAPAAPATTADRSRDVSPMTKPAGSSPLVTDGVTSPTAVPATTGASALTSGPRPGATTAGTTATPEKKRHSFMGSRKTPESAKSDAGASTGDGSGKKKGFLKRLADKLNARKLFCCHATPFCACSDSDEAPAFAEPRYGGNATAVEMVGRKNETTVEMEGKLKFTAREIGGEGEEEEEDGHASSQDKPQIRSPGPNTSAQSAPDSTAQPEPEVPDSPESWNNFYHNNRDPSSPSSPFPPTNTNTNPARQHRRRASVRDLPSIDTTVPSPSLSRSGGGRRSVRFSLGSEKVVPSTMRQGLRREREEGFGSVVEEAAEEGQEGSRAQAGRLVKGAGGGGEGRMGSLVGILRKAGGGEGGGGERVEGVATKGEDDGLKEMGEQRAAGEDVAPRKKEKEWTVEEGKKEEVVEELGASSESAKLETLGVTEHQPADAEAKSFSKPSAQPEATSPSDAATQKPTSPKTGSSPLRRPSLAERREENIGNPGTASLGLLVRLRRPSAKTLDAEGDGIEALAAYTPLRRCETVYGRGSIAQPPPPQLPALRTDEQTLLDTVEEELESAREREQQRLERERLNKVATSPPVSRVRTQRAPAQFRPHKARVNLVPSREQSQLTGNEVLPVKELRQQNPEDVDAILPAPPDFQNPPWVGEGVERENVVSSPLSFQRRAVGNNFNPSAPPPHTSITGQTGNTAGAQASEAQERPASSVYSEGQSRDPKDPADGQKKAARDALTVAVGAALGGEEEEEQERENSQESEIERWVNSQRPSEQLSPEEQTLDESPPEQGSRSMRRRVSDGLLRGLSRLREVGMPEAAQ
ncbi:hypothetical protein LTR62_003809 [Meristemomyces frigidus]|uniref:AMP-activated protein kinase glycogen-binding domain-containing protein n=1 Tax=Meristemomyces frigidus TaxID=1508187 RepID=A0AAN7TF10_9PEZI|nr:hypothetical protein LTR62_003809 [Meristemomyces frigidus]